MKLYTKTGDAGMTSVIGKRVSKDHIRVDTYGTFDELNSFIGLSRASLDKTLFNDVDGELEKIQHELFDCGADIANINKIGDWRIGIEEISFLEERIDFYSNQCTPLNQFILPGGCTSAASLHVCRTVARRAERNLVTLQTEVQFTNNEISIYFNRLSDYFFALARYVNYKSDYTDVKYRG